MYASNPVYLNEIVSTDLGGHKVFVGSRVNVRWKDEWYDGKVLKLGPKRNLCRVREIMAHSVLFVQH